MIPPARQPAASAVVGLQWGDEGKGKVVDLLARDHDYVVRYNGGANAGHSVTIDGRRHALHLLPSGFLSPNVVCVVGNGVVVDPWQLLEEMDSLRGTPHASLCLSDRAHLVLPYHKLQDERLEAQLAAESGGGQSALGTTKRGIGPAYADKASRALALRVGDVLRRDHLRARLERICAMKRLAMPELAHDPALDPGLLFRRLTEIAPRLEPLITDTTYLLHQARREGKRLLFEGANATLLDIDHGTYPNVTSSASSVLGVGSGSGIPPTCLTRVLGVCKAYCTRVGTGPMPTEIHGPIGDRIREVGREYGTTTGRPRRIGWLDLVALRYAAMINGVTGLALTMLDVLAGIDEIRVCVAYRWRGQRTERFLPDATDLAEAEPEFVALQGFQEDVREARTVRELPDAARRFVEYLQDYVGAQVDVIGVGPDRAHTILTHP